MNSVDSDTRPVLFNFIKNDPKFSTTGKFPRISKFNFLPCVDLEAHAAGNVSNSTSNLKVEIQELQIEVQQEEP